MGRARLMIPIRIGAFIPAKPTYSESQGNLVKILDASGSSGKDLRMRTKSRDPVIPGPCSVAEGMGIRR